MKAAFALGALIIAAGCTSGPEIICESVPIGQVVDLVDNPEIEVQIDLEIFDGQMWLGYTGSEGDGSSNLATFISKVSCDGTPGQPIKISEPGRNHVDPTLRANGDKMMVAWSSDKGGDPTENLDIVYRLVGPEGETLTPQTDAQTTYQGMPMTKNHWLPKVTTLDDGWAFTGVRGIPDVPGFQAFVERLDENGDVVTPTLGPAPETDVSHFYPDIASDQDKLRVAWGRIDANQTADHIMEAIVDPEAKAWTAKADRVSQGRGDRPVYSRGNNKFGRVVFYRDNISDMILLTAPTLDGNHVQMVVGNENRVAQLPAMAMGPGTRGILAWHENVAGTQNKVLISEIFFDGTYLYNEDIIELTNEALPYGPTVIHVQEDIFLIAWTSTTAGGDRKAKGYFYQLPNRAD